MASPAPSLVFDTGFDPQTGTAVSVAPGIVRVTAPNASPYTFTGTNSFLLGTDTVAILDPGPDDSAHRAALEAAIAGRKVSAIILTHTHRDHSALARPLAETLRAPLWFGGPHRLSRPLRRFERNPICRSGDWSLVPDRVLRDGDILALDGLSLSVHATPGHCANHMAFGIADNDILLTGDHIMGWNSTLVSVPDGSMADYFASLDKVLALPYRLYLPAHGGPIADGPAYAEALKAHRQRRNEQIVTAVRKGADTLGAITDAIYSKLSLPVRRAALMTVTAHVEYLEGLGVIRLRRGLFGLRIEAA